jgi:hypothetical protein
MRRPAIRSHLRFQGFHFPAKYESVRVENAGQACLDLVSQLSVLFGKVEQRNFHWASKSRF